MCYSHYGTLVYQHSLALSLDALSRRRYNSTVYERNRTQRNLASVYTPMYEILVEDKFDAAHCLRGYPGNCERLHGHTYRVQVRLRTKETDSIGMALDFRSVRASIKEITDHLDHIYLNDLPEFSTENPSAENLARYIYGRMSDKYAGMVHKVTVWETETAAASYWEE